MQDDWDRLDADIKRSSKYFIRPTLTIRERLQRWWFWHRPRWIP